MAVTKYILQPADLFDDLPVGIPVHYIADAFTDLSGLGADGDVAYAADTDLEYTYTGRAGWVAKQASDKSVSIPEGEGLLVGVDTGSGSATAGKVTIAG